MAGEPDLVLYDRSGDKVAVVEIKNRRGTSRQWATEFRRNLADYGLLRGAEFFLLATPDRLYLWRGAGDGSAMEPPDYEVDGGSVFARYFDRAHLDPDHISGDAFELIVATWLSALALEFQEPSNQDWLVQSGFLDAIRNGRVRHQAAA